MCGCKKQLLEDKGCTNRIIIPVTSHQSLTDSDYNFINSLFISNEIRTDNYRYTSLRFNSLNGYKYTIVCITQYINGLPVFIQNLNYVFVNRTIQHSTGHVINGTSLDSKSALTLRQLRKLFIDDIESFNGKGNQYKDSCFNAEFGYYNLNADTGNESIKLIKAWHVTPKFSSYPEAYYQDNSGKRIYYFDGIIE